MYRFGYSSIGLSISKRVPKGNLARHIFKLGILLLNAKEVKDWSR